MHLTCPGADQTVLELLNRPGALRSAHPAYTLKLAESVMPPCDYNNDQVQASKGMKFSR